MRRLALVLIVAVAAFVSIGRSPQTQTTALHRSAERHPAGPLRGEGAPAKANVLVILLAGRPDLMAGRTYDGGRPGAGGTGRLYVNGSKIGEDRIANTQPNVFSGGGGADVGMDEGTPVTEAYQVPAKFTGTC